MTCRKLPKQGQATRQRIGLLSLTAARAHQNSTLSDEQKAGANRVFFHQVKEEFIPGSTQGAGDLAREGGVRRDGEEAIIAAKRPVRHWANVYRHAVSWASIITSGHADGLPLYRLFRCSSAWGGGEPN